MDETEALEVCRLCLEFTDSFELVTDTDRNILKDIVPNIVIDSLENHYLCNVCSKNLLRSCEFRQKVLVTKNVSAQSNEALENTIAGVNVKKEASQNCCLCHKQEVCDSVVSDEHLSDMLQRCFPESENIYLLTPSSICNCCLEDLEVFYNLIGACLTAEDRIQKYIIENNLENGSDVNLREVAIATTSEAIKEEMEISIDDSNSSLFKYEPETELEENSEEEGQTAISRVNLDSCPLNFYEQALLLVLLCRRRRRRKRLRRFWVSPFAAERYQKGLFYNLYRELREDNAKFSEHFGVSVKSFDEILEIIGEEITGKYTTMRRCVPPDEKLALTLRYLTTGLSMIKLHRAFRLGTSTISTIIQSVCRALCGALHRQYVPKPNKNGWSEICEKFERNFNFPHCLGAIGCKKVEVVNCAIYKESLFFIAVCDSEYRFLHFEIGSSSIEGWKDTEFYKKVSTNAFNIPEPTEINGSGFVAPYVFIGDSTFSSASYLLRPFSGRNLSVKQKVFNYRLCRARRQVDSAFGIVSNKWQILQKRFDVSMDFAILIIKSCCVLHNFLLDREGYEFEHTLSIRGLNDMDWYWKQGGRLTAKIREGFADYFVSEAGQVPWQMDRI